MNQPVKPNEVAEYIKQYGQTAKFNTKSESNVNIRNRVDEMLAFAARRDMRELRKTDKISFRGKMIEQFQDTYKKYPKLFNNIVDNDKFDYHRLLEMLDLKHSVATSQNVNSAYDKANEKIGTKYFNEFVPSNIKNVYKQ